MISSPSAQIINALAESNFMIGSKGKRVEAYGPVMGIATAIIALGIAVTTAFGPEKRGRSFEIPAPIDMANVKDIEQGRDSMDKKQEERVEVVQKE
jgi:hypothetical protein